MLSRRIIHAQEDERRQIARELHDEIGQAMTSVKINLQGLVNQAAGQDERAIECHRDRQRRVESRARHGPRPTPGAAGRPGARRGVQWYVERHARRTNLEGRFIADPEDLRGPGGGDGLLPRGPGGAHEHRPACAGEPIQRRVVAAQPRAGIDRPR